MLRPSAESRQRAHLRITEVLARLASSSATPVNPYVANYLSAHAGAAGRPGWTVLSDHDLALDQLDPEAVAADAMRTAFGRFPLPAQVEAVVAARRDLGNAGLDDRRGVREIWLARHVRHLRGTGRQSPRGEPWSLLWARMERQSVHVAMAGHSRAVTGIAVIPPVDGRHLMATASLDGSVRLWDLATAAPVGDPVYSSVDVRGRLPPASPGWKYPITALASFTGSDGRTVLVIAASDADFGGVIDFRDPIRGERSRPSIPCDVAVRAMTTVHLPGAGTALVTGDSVGAVRLWHLDDAADPGAELFRHTASVRVATTTAHPDGSTLLVTGGDDGVLHCWDVARQREVGQPMITARPISSIATLPLPDGTRMLALAGGDRAVRLIDVASLPRHGGLAAITGLGTFVEGHTGRVLAVAALHLSDSHAVLASTGRDGTVRLWDPAVDDWTAHRRSSSSSRPLGFGIGTTPVLAALPRAGGRSTIVSGGADGTVRIWDPSSTVDVPGESRGQRRSAVGLMTTVPLAGGRRLLATAASDGYVRWWDAHTGNVEGYPLRSQRDGAPVSVNSLPDDDDRTTLVTLHDNGVVRLWNPADRWRWRHPPDRRSRILTGDWATAVANLPFAGGENLVAIGGFGGSINLLRPRRRALPWRRQVGRELLGHVATVTDLAALSSGGRTYVASVSNDDRAGVGELVIWAPPSRSRPRSLWWPRVLGRPVETRGAPIRGLAVVRVEPDRELLVVAYADGHLASVDPVTAETVAATDRGARRFVTHPDGQLVSLDPVAEMVTATGRRVRRFIDTLTVIDYAEGGPLLATSDGAEIRLWDPVRMELLDTIDVATRILTMTGFADGCLGVGTVDGPAVLKIHRPERNRRKGQRPWR